MTEKLPDSKLMSAADAEAACRRIDANLSSIDDELQAIHAGQGWLALGFSTFSALIEQRLGTTRRNAQRRVAKIEIVAAIAASMPKNDARVAPVISDRQAATLSKNPAARRKVIDVVSKGADPVEAVERVLAKSTPKPEQMRLWPDDPQKAMFASFDVVLDELGPERTEKLVRTLLARVTRATPKPSTLVDEPRQVACTHPKSKEDKKPYGVWCGVCRIKIR